MQKSALRKIYLEKLKSLSAEERREKSLKICERFFEAFDLSNVRVVHLFLSIEKNNEVETWLFYERLWREFPQIVTVIPRMRGEMLETLEFTVKTILVENARRIPEPVGEELFDEKMIDLVLMPLLCFDKTGGRVGYGKGFYDKFLKNCRADCRKIGLSFYPPTEKIEDLNEFDVRLDYCLTPDSTFDFGF